MPSTNRPSPEASATPRQRARLPVNPRRVKVAPEERKRVVRACNACNIRRVKCSGGQPCDRCCKVQRVCEYPAPESDKGALKNELASLRSRCAALEKCLKSTAPDSAADVLRQLERGDSVPCPPTPTASDPPDHLHPTDDSEPADGRMLCDPDGTVRHLGVTSGANFLDHLKHFMFLIGPVTCQPDDAADASSFVTSIGQYQTFDSRPLANPDVNPLWLPSPAEMSAMLDQLAYYIQDGGGSFPSGGIYWWGDLHTVPSPGVGSASLNTMTTDESFRHLAFYHVCFALSSSLAHSSYRHSDQHTGEAYFKRARVLIGNPLDTVRFTLGDVPVLTLMAFYLIEINRRDAAYMYLGLAVRIGVMHGAFSSCQNENSRRIIWTVYILDRWLSVLMGRVPAIADEAVRIALPREVAGLPPSAGLRAHVELSRISNYIVCETFRIAPRKHGQTGSAADIDIALDMLRAWELQLPSSLQMPEDLTHPDPTCCMLHMAHNQLLILVTRPVFFAAVKHAVAQRIVHGENPTDEFEQGPYIPACSAAAHRNLLLAQRVFTKERKPLQAGLHFVFNAAVVLLLQRLMRGTMPAESGQSSARSSSPASCHEDAKPVIAFAIDCFENEAKTGTHYARDCCKILQDLSALTQRYVAYQGLPVQQKSTGTGEDVLDRQHPLADRGSKSAADLHASPQPPFLAELLTWMHGDGLDMNV